MTLPVIVGVGNVAAGTGDVVPTNPTGSISGDALFMVVEQSAVNVYGAIPTGWAGVPGAQLKVGSTADDGNITVYTRRFQTGDTSPTVPDTINHTSARIIGVRGCIATGTPWELVVAGLDANVDTAFSASGTVTLGSDRLVLIFGGTAPDIASTTEVSGFANLDLANVTERMDDYNTNGNGGGFFCASGEKATQGAFGATTATLVTLANKAWAVLVLRPPEGGGEPQTYEASLNVSRRESVLDRMTNNISPLILLAQKDGVSDGMNNNIPKNSSMNKVLTLSDSAGTGIFPALTLLQILATTTAKSANMQGSVGLGGDFGIGGSSNNNINPNASLLAHMGVNLSGGLSLLSSLTIAERLGFSVLGQVSIYPSLILGRDLAFVPANISLIGGSVTLGQTLGLIDVPRLDALASVAFLQALGINLSSALSTTQVEAVLALAEHLGLGVSAQLNSFPLVGLGERLFLLDANNANLFGTNVLNEVRGLNIAGGLSIQDNVAIPIDLNILTNKLISNLVNVSIQERLGISDSVFANMQASVSLDETAGMGNAVSQILNAGLSINVVGSVLTISGLTVIIVKGFVFTSDSTRNPVLAQDSSKTTSSSDSGTSSVTTTMSPNYISTDDD